MFDLMIYCSSLLQVGQCTFTLVYNILYMFDLMTYCSSMLQVGQCTFTFVYNRWKHIIVRIKRGVVAFDNNWEAFSKMEETQTKIMAS